MSQDSNPQDPDTRALTETAAPTSGEEPNTGLKLVALKSSADGVDEAPPADSFPGPGSKPSLIGYTIDGRYKVEAVLGEGGMGVVYRARHKIIDKKVAMKVLRSDMARDKEVTERFLTEARAASAIGHEHIIDISDFGLLPDGSTYFVMEYLDGQSLLKVLEGQNPVPIPRLLHIAVQLAEGLAAAHDAGIVHRDLKPDNIFLISRGSDRDFVKILDFGIAKVSTSATGGLTRAGTVFGTPHYMSPEQAAGTAVDHRGDVYSFGVILYELACGKVPFDADNFMGILTQHMYKAPVPIRALVPPPQDVPPGLEAVILKCLSKKPEHRYQSMRELHADLKKLEAGVVPDAVAEMMARSGGFSVPNDYFKAKMPEPMPATPRRSGPRWPVIAGAAGVSVAVGLVVAIFAQSKVSPASPTAVPKPPVVEAPARPAAVAPAVAPAAPAKKPVAIAAEPIDAEVFRDDKSLGTSPVVVDVEAGAPVTLEVRRKGYVTEQIVLDGSEPKLSVKLEREGRAGAARTYAPPSGATRPAGAGPAPARKPRSSLGGGEVVDPWAR